MIYSKERIYQSCNLHGHCLGAHLYPAIHVEDKLVDFVSILKMIVSETEAEILFCNIVKGINTNEGTINVECLPLIENQKFPFTLTLPLSHIYEIESVENR